MSKESKKCVVCAQSCKTEINSVDGPVCSKSHKRHVDYLHLEKDKTESESE